MGEDVKRSGFGIALIVLSGFSLAGERYEIRVTMAGLNTAEEVVEVDASSCQSILDTGGSTGSGAYSVIPGDGLGPIDVYCDMVTDGGGWTVIQSRATGSVDFYKGWISYKTGFGNLGGEFWLGNEKISRITAGGSELQVRLWGGGHYGYAKFSSFSLSGESDGYRLQASGYSGTAGDALTYHSGQNFTTYDRDNDPSSGNCAVTYAGAWWYKTCHLSNLNGPFGAGSAKGNVWHGDAPFTYSLALDRTTMMVR